MEKIKTVIGIICSNLKDSFEYIEENKLTEWYCFWGDAEENVYPPFINELRETESAKANPNYESLKEKLTSILKP